ncbi:MAG: type II toxin-antitoxin system VapC family toxin [Desulfobacteraceae bacterium]|nr:MAG: type II toxin-antitoxin system VapC family toxin [Desulfobacteraceae bacterium]
MKYLLDTNVLSESLKAAPDRHVMAMIEKLWDQIVTAAPVWHELLYGCMRLPVSRKRKLVEAYLQNVVWLNVDILPYDDRAAAWHAEQRARLTAKGQTPSFVDGQIAAIAKVNGLVLVTRNTDDFSNFEDLEVTNWHRDIRED